VRLLHAGHGDVGGPVAAGQAQASEQEIREGLEGNICRCTGYHNIVKRDPAVPERQGRCHGHHGGEDTMTDMSNSPIGKPLLRREDGRFLTGAGQYTDDVVLPGQTYGVFLRAARPCAHQQHRPQAPRWPRPAC
jgi:hypothetical protein